MPTKAHIDGSWVTTPKTYSNVDPATGLVLGEVARCDAADVDAAVAAATRAQVAWARRRPEERARILIATADLIERDSERLAVLESEDTGKPLTQARHDAAICARYFRFYGQAVESFYGSSIPLSDDLLVYTRNEPFGVVGSILAWNYPMQLLARAVAPALATGNACVVKPADETPRTAVSVSQLFVEAGGPPGVLNVVTGLGAEAGAAVAEHPGIAHVGFVGSTETGAKVAAAAAHRVAPTILELGGKSAHLVFPDADLQNVSDHVVRAILQNAGQTCSAGSRVVVHREVREELLELLVARFRDVTIGRGLDDPDLGPLISTRQSERVRGMVERCDSGSILIGGTAPDDNALAAGAYFAPTLIDDVDPMAEIAQEEVFGPVVVSMPFDTEEEAIQIANCTPYALLGAIWTHDLSRAHRLAAATVAGQVYVSAYGAGGGVELPFGGFRKSGYGREKGIQALAAYTESKTVVVQL